MEFVFVNLMIGLLMGFVVMAIADSKGYEQSFGWFFYGLMIWPVALIHSLILEKKENHHEGDTREIPYNEPAKEKESSIIILPERDLLLERKKRESVERERIAKMEARQSARLEHDKKFNKQGETIALVISGVIIFMILLVAIVTAG